MPHVACGVHCGRRMGGVFVYFPWLALLDAIRTAGFPTMTFRTELCGNSGLAA